MKIVRESKSESFRIPPPLQMKIVRESESESFRIPPQNENCQRFQIQEFQNPQNENCQRVQIRGFQNTPPQW